MYILMPSCERPRRQMWIWSCVNASIAGVWILPRWYLCMRRTCVSSRWNRLWHEHEWRRTAWVTRFWHGNMWRIFIIWPNVIKAFIISQSKAKKSFFPFKKHVCMRFLWRDMRSQANIYAIDEIILLLHRHNARRSAAILNDIIASSEYGILSMMTVARRE